MALNEFSLDLSKFAEIAKNRMSIVSRKAFIELSSEIIATTPVDEGRLRANWFPAIDSYSIEQTESTDEDKATNKVVSTFNKAQLGQMMTLTNNMPYASDIEFGLYGDGPLTVSGFSKKAPAGMVRVNIARWNKYIDEQVRKLK